MVNTSLLDYDSNLTKSLKKENKLKILNKTKFNYYYLLYIQIDLLLIIFI